MNPQDNPHFTAYVLGELSAEEAHDFHEELATTPGAAHHLEQVEAVADALRHGAPIAQARLTHEQRHAVLHPANLPRKIQPMMPRKPAARPRHVFWPVMAGVLKVAAVVSLTGAAFFAGWSFSPNVSGAMQAMTSSIDQEITEPVLEKRPEIHSQSPVDNPVVKTVAPVPLVAKNSAEIEPPKKDEKAKVTTSAPAATAVVPAKKEIKEVVIAAPVPPAKAGGSPSYGFSMPQGRATFASTTKQPSDQFNLRPSLIRPAPPKLQGQAFASPPSANIKATPQPSRQQDLYIHSWQAEVASCPWNEANRLLRVVIQLPADQPAVFDNKAGYSLHVAFDPATVKQFRLLCERHQVASELRSAGMHVVWYEFQPNGSSESGRQIASVTLPNARFTSQAVGPFDSSTLHVIDRGYSLQNAREEFVFEASVVGFGLLLRGAEQLGALNHGLVLDLAKRVKGPDANGERSRFIRLVQDAERVAGL